MAAEFGLWASSYTEGDLPAMKAHAVALRSDVETSTYAAGFGERPFLCAPAFPRV